MTYLKREKQVTEVIKNMISRVDTLTERVALTAFAEV